MRRTIAQLEVFEVEVAQQELDIINGVKSRLQDEMISIAETNKRLRSEGEVEKGRIYQELEEKRTSTTNEVSSLNKSIQDKIIINKKLEEEGMTFLKNNEILLNNNIDLKSKNDSLLLIYNDNVNKTNHLAMEKSKYEREISKHTGEIKILNELNKGLQHSVFVLETKTKEMTQEVTSLQLKIEQGKLDIESSNLNVSEASKKLSQIVIDLSVKNKELQDLNIEVERSKKEVEDYRIEVDKQSNELNEKQKNYKLLEQRVDEKLELFARFKEKFTVDELAKMKIHANLV